MDFDQNHYYNLNAYLMILVGQWPYLDHRFNKFLRFWIILIGVVSVVSQSIRLTRRIKEFEVVIEIVPCFVIASCCTICFLVLHSNDAKIKEIIDSLRSDWDCFYTKEELKIKESFAEEGKQITLQAIYIFIVIMVLFVPAALNSQILDLVLPLNETRRRTLPFEAELFIDEEKYYYEIIFCMSGAHFVLITVVLANCTAFLVFLQHALGMLAVVEYRLQSISNMKSINDLNYDKKYNANKTMYGLLLLIIESHQRSLEFVRLIELTYRFCIMVIISSLLIISSGALVNLGKFQSTLQIIGIFFFSYAPYYIGQKLTDMSIIISRQVYETNWYEESRESQKLVLFLLKRSQKYCTLTIYNFIGLTFEEFSAILRVVISYYTVMRSFMKSS